MSFNNWLSIEDIQAYHERSRLDEENRALRQTKDAYKKDYEELKQERNRAVEFIQYLDKQYGNYMTEDERFKEWRGKTILK